MYNHILRDVNGYRYRVIVKTKKLDVDQLEFIGKIASIKEYPSLIAVIELLSKYKNNSDNELGIRIDSIDGISMDSSISENN